MACRVLGRAAAAGVGAGKTPLYDKVRADALARISGAAQKALSHAERRAQMSESLAGFECDTTDGSITPEGAAIIRNGSLTKSRAHSLPPDSDKK